MEDRYQGRWDIHIMADYCWNLQRECTNKTHSKLSNKRSFLSDTLRKHLNKLF